MIFKRVYNKLQEYGKLVMFSHTIFSLGFAVLSMLLAGEGLPELRTLFWIMVCFLGARTGANALNRVIDAEIDARNPRTANRQIPQGEMKIKEVLIFASVCLLIMLIGAYNLNMICFLLSPIALFLLIIYSYCKRFTYLCHLVLGTTCACAPVGAWLAVTGELSLIPLIMGVANCLWVAGFDIIYGSQDYEFDTANGIHSIPARFGVKNALRISTFFHIITMIALVLIGVLSSELGIVYAIGMLIICILLIMEHRMVSPTNLTNANIASYNVTQLISLVLLVTGVIDTLFL